MNVHVMGVYVLCLRHRPLATTIHVRCLFMFIHGLKVDINVNVTMSTVHANKFRELAVTIACLTPCFFPEL